MTLVMITNIQTHLYAIVKWNNTKHITQKEYKSKRAFKHHGDNAHISFKPLYKSIETADFDALHALRQYFRNVLRRNLFPKEIRMKSQEGTNYIHVQKKQNQIQKESYFPHKLSLS